MGNSGAVYIKTNPQAIAFQSATGAVRSLQQSGIMPPLTKNASLLYGLFCYDAHTLKVYCLLLEQNITRCVGS